jgi:hypothetical protein
MTARIPNLAAVKPSAEFVPAHRPARRVLPVFLAALFTRSFKPVEHPGLSKLELI